MSKIINSYTLGDMQAIYVLNEDNNNPELVILPGGVNYEDKDDTKEKPYPDSLVQVKIVGDTYMGAYASGVTMRQSPTTTGFKYKEQICNKTGDNVQIVTRLEDGRGYEVRHYLTHSEGKRSLGSYTQFENKSKESVSLELLSSFSLGKISPLMDGDGHETLKMHRIRSVWSMEGRKETRTLEDMQLEPSWGGHAVRCERFGCAGSLPVSKYFPTLVIEDEKNDLFWGAQLMHNASWQLEVYRRGDYVQMSGGLADRELGHWVKEIKPGDIFTSPVAILSVCQSNDKEEIFQRMTGALLDDFKNGPESEQSLPIIFNEYCTTWGNPSHDNIKEIINAIKGKPFEYFVIDCGWFKEAGVHWDISMGDYVPSKELFPDGLDATTKMIHDAGLKAGIWFEIDNVGSASRAYNNEDMLLKRDGQVLTTTMRRFWDLRQEKVQEYLTERVIGCLKKNHFDYMKIDCNDTVGIGCDGAESLGEGLRQNQQASVEFIRKVKRECPDIVLENCASGGYKLEPLMMSTCSMASFSDAHECEEIPIIAANLHRTILPAQSQIWAVIREKDSLKRIAYSVINTFLGRMCISGDVCGLSSEQWDVIDRGMAVYKKIAPIIKEGYTSFYGPSIESYRHPKGWQGILRQGTSFDNLGEAFMVIHGFNEIAGSKIEIELPNDYRIKEYYSYCEENVCIKDGKLYYTFHDDMEAICVLLGV